ncbi:MAG: RNA polymerase sigma-70 factor [Cytophagales bacterium]|nr:MAG: RNA polymerase sigma-70 factor [Cytophagales bacterium]
MKSRLLFAKFSEKEKPVELQITQEGEAKTVYIADDEVFIRKVIEANAEKGYELLFKRYYRPLCSHAVRFLYSKELAEDIVSEIFCTFWQKKTYLQIQTSYRAYLFTSVRHQAYAYLQSEFGRLQNTDIEQVKAATTLPNPQQILQYNELYLKMEEVIRAISPQSQKVFMMSRFEGKKNPIIAEELQISVKTVEGHITKALSILRKTLQDGFISIFLFMTSNMWFF